MSIRVALVPLFGSQEDLGGLNAANHVARRFEGRLIGLFVRIPSQDIVPYVGEGVSTAAIEQLMRASEEEMDRRRDQAREHFRSACDAAKVPIVGEVEEAAGFAAHFVEVTGQREDVIPARARLADLTVFSRGAAMADLERSAIEATLFGAGRPLMVVPQGWTGSVGHRIAIAWNGSREAARALGAALPLLESATGVHILVADASQAQFDTTRDVAAYLKRHGVSCERLAVDVGDEALGAALLRQARELGVDLLVMGGYGRSRLSEMVLGGVTRHVLAETQLPVLLDH